MAARKFSREHCKRLARAAFGSVGERFALPSVRTAGRNGRAEPSPTVGVFFLAAATLLNASGPKPALAASRTKQQTAARRNYARLPLAFEKNDGQFNRRVAFAARGNGYGVFLTGGGVTIEVRGQESGGRREKTGVRSQESGVRSWKEESRQQSAISRQLPGRPDVIQLRLVGARRRAKVMGRGELAGKVNYLIGRDARRWRRNVPLFSRVEYEGIYPGIIMAFHGRGGKLEFDFMLAPGASVARIRLHIASRESKVAVAANGDLVIATGAGEVRFRKPVAYQTTGAGDWGLGTGEDGRKARNDSVDSRSKIQDSRFIAGPRTKIQNRRFIPARFVMLGNGQIGFAIGRYNPALPLVIDPVLDYSTYLGGTGFDAATSIAVDAAGDAYIAGYTTSIVLPTAAALQNAYSGGSCNTDMSAAPCFDAFVAKLNAAGTALDYATYLGGSGDDRATAIAVDAAGEAFVAGYTGSQDFPVANGVQGSIGGGTCGSAANPYPCYDAFVARLAASGSSLIYSTHLGGTGDDYATGVAIDSSLNAYLAGFTSGGNFPVTGGAFEPSFGGGPYDAFVAKIGANGSKLLYATFLGGSGEDRAAAIAVDGSGDAYVTGQTDSRNFPAKNALQPAYAGGSCGCFDAFVTKLNGGGSGAIYSTYLGGTGGDYGDAIAVDSAGEAYVAGWTTSADFPVTAAAYQKTYGGSDDAFVSKIGATGNALAYSTYFGGIDPEQANGIALGSAGDAIIAGSDYGVGMPVLGALESGNSGFYDGFVAAFDPTGSNLIYATWLGGSGDDDANAVVADSAGNAYVTGETFSTDFPTTPGSFQTAYGGGGYDAFVAKISPASAAGVAIVPDPVTFGDQEIGTSSPAQNIKVTNAGSAALDLTGVAATGDFAVTNGCPATIAGGASCSVSLTFKPTATGARTGTLSLSDNAGGGRQTVPLSGTGTSGAVNLSAASLSFGQVAVGTSSAAQSVSLTNTGATPLLISGIQAAGDYSQTNNCGASVATGASCAIKIVFTPSAAGASAGQIVITDSAPTSPQSVTLAGTGTEPAAGLTPPSLDFGNQEVGGTSAAQTVTLANSGNGALEISSISASSPFAQTNNCGASLAAGAGCTISVTFAPTASGAASGKLTVNDNAAGSPQSVALAGSGIAPAVELSPASLSFGTVNDGTTSPAQGVTLTNTGTAALAITSVAATGDYSAASGCGESLAAGSSCTINVTFAPTASGAASGTLAINDNAAGSPQQVALSGTGADPAPAVTITPSALTFSSQALGTASAPQQVTLINTGTAALNITGITASGDFSVAASCSAPLQPGQNCAASVTFKPTAKGARTGKVTLTDNASNSPQSVTLAGTGVADFTLSSPGGVQKIVRGTDQATFSVSVAAAAGFSGAVELACSNAGGGSCSFNPATVAAGGGSSTLTVSGLAGAGGSSVALAVTGASGGQTASLGLSVEIMDFSLAASPSSATVAAGGPADYQVSLVPVNGFNDAVSIASSGLPAGAACSLSPAQVTPNGTSESTLAVTVTTSSGALAQPGSWNHEDRFRGLPGRGRRELVLILMLFMAAMVAGVVGGRRRKLLVPALLAISLMSGCGGGGGGGGYTPPAQSGTPAGSYTITVQATSGPLSHSTNLTLVVQ